MSGNHNQSLDRALEIVEAAPKLYTTILKDFMVKPNQTVWVGDDPTCDFEVPNKSRKYYSKD